MRNLKQELFKLVRMLYKKNIFLLLSLVLIFVISVHIRLNAIEPVKIGKHYQEDIEINFSVIDRMFKPEEEKIYINKDVRTKIKKKIEKKIQNFLSTEIEWKPLNSVEVSKDKVEPVTDFLEALENDDDVQRVYTNLKFGNN